MAPVKSLHVGVFLPTPPSSAHGAQLLDLACVDIFGILSKNYLENLPDTLTAGIDPTVVASAPEVTISYIGARRPAGALLTLSSNLTLRLTHHFSDAAVRPGQLDVVLVPGPDPQETWDPEALAWLAAQLANGACGTTTTTTTTNDENATAHAAATTTTTTHTGTDVLSVCTGIYICGEAGLLRGRKACGPQFMQEDIRQRFEGVELVGGERRWVRDGNFWSSGHVTNGNDLVSAYCRESGRFSLPLVEIVLAIADVGNRPVMYSQKEE